MHSQQILSRKPGENWRMQIVSIIQDGLHEEEIKVKKTGGNGSGPV